MNNEMVKGGIGSKIYVLHHGDSDGYAAAVCMYGVFGENAKYIPVQYNRPFPIDIEIIDKDTDIYIVDFSYKREILDPVYEKAGKLKVIDHHETAEHELKDCPYAYFDMNYAGADLTYLYVHGENAFEDRHELYKLTSDRDLWKFNYPDSKALEAGLKSSGQYNNLLFWVELTQNNKLWQETLERGRILAAQTEAKLKDFKNGRKFVVMETTDFRFALYNQVDLISETAEVLYLDPELNLHFTMSYFVEASTGSIIFSLRSLKNGGTKVSAIAKLFGGGGHSPAAGFSTKLNEGLDLLAELYSPNCGRFGAMLSEARDKIIY